MTYPKQTLLKVLRYCAPDPVKIVQRLYKEYGKEPNLFRAHYYAWLNRWCARRSELSSGNVSEGRKFQYIDLDPRIKRTLVRAATTDAARKENITLECATATVSIHIFQDWKVFIQDHGRPVMSN